MEFFYFTNENTSSNLINNFNIKLIDGINTQLLHYRELVYSFLGGRQTHIKILIILSVYLLNKIENKH